MVQGISCHSHLLHLLGATLLDELGQLGALCTGHFTVGRTALEGVNLDAFGEVHRLGWAVLSVFAAMVAMGGSVVRVVSIGQHLLESLLHQFL